MAQFYQEFYQNLISLVLVNSGGPGAGFIFGTEFDIKRRLIETGNDWVTEATNYWNLMKSQEEQISQHHL